MTLFDFKRLTTRLLAPTVCLVVISMVVLGVLLIVNQRVILNKETSDSQIDQLQKALDGLKSNGEYKKILNKYLQ